MGDGGLTSVTGGGVEGGGALFSTENGCTTGAFSAKADTHASIVATTAPIHRIESLGAARPVNLVAEKQYKQK